ncbi:MAG: glutaredoxin family protein [Zetaproteobacteria bacterium]|nr:MAG: glutaredoxin family protein [Zetaproteobacteria bacterium]
MRLHLRLLSRADCCLCETMKAVLDEAADAGWCSWEEVNVDRDQALRARYGADVPVLLFGDRVLFKHRVTRDALLAALRREKR